MTSLRRCGRAAAGYDREQAGNFPKTHGEDPDLASRATSPEGRRSNPPSAARRQPALELRIRLLQVGLTQKRFAPVRVSDRTIAAPAKCQSAHKFHVTHGTTEARATKTAGTGKPCWLRRRSWDGSLRKPGQYQQRNCRPSREDDAVNLAEPISRSSLRVYDCPNWRRL